MHKNKLAPYLFSLGLLALMLAMTENNAALADDDGFATADWRSVLDRFVDEQGLVDYQGLANSRQGLDRVVDRIAHVSPRSHPDLFPDRDAELAYYINAYNALVFHGVLAKGPDITSVWGRSGTGYGFFMSNKVVIGGEKVSLKKFEDDWIRAGYQDPRIHAALNCASLGCPRLPRTPVSAERLGEELDAAMNKLVSDERHCRVDAQRRTVTLSKIFEWFTKDFLDYERGQGSSSPSLIDYVNRYRSADARIPGDYRVQFSKYDKGLNRQP